MAIVQTRKLTKLFKKGVVKAKEAADAASQSIRDDINKRS